LNTRHKGQAKVEQTIVLFVCLVFSSLSCLVISVLSVCLDSKLDAVQQCHDAKCRELLTVILTLTLTLTLTVFRRQVTKRSRLEAILAGFVVRTRLIFLVS
jgi:hypothetical protein